MRAHIFLAAFFVCFTVIAVRWIERERGASASEIATAQIEPAAPEKPAANASSWGREVRIAVARDHQYYADADVNRRTQHFLIDTGASYVALRDSDAREAGIYTSWTDFIYPVRTANGETKAAMVTIDEMELNGIRVEGVKAFILPDDQLSVNLLGMSFLSRLDSVEAKAGEMVLKG